MKEKIERFLKKYNKKNKIIIKGGVLTVGGWLDLSNTNITELPEGLTVEGWLDLSSTNITELPEGLTVGGWLDLRNTNIKELPDNLTVNGTLYGFNGDRIISIKKVLKGYNEELRYIYFDGILWGNVKLVKKAKNITIYKTPLGYCVVEKELSAHAFTLREAIEDLTFKKMKSIDTSKIVEEIRSTGKVTRSQYRAITGACSFGTNKFCEDHNIQDLEEIELDKLRRILINDYGAKEFWKMIDGKEVE